MRFSKRQDCIKDFVHRIASDGCYVWVVRRSNYQNDQIRAKSVEYIEEDERPREMAKNQPHTKIFLCLLASGHFGLSEIKENVQ